MRALLIIITLSFCFNAYPAEWEKIDGIYAVTAKNMVSPIEDSHYRIQFRGQSAKDLYDSMKVTPRKIECAGDNAKQIGAMLCLYNKPDKIYECHFSINIAEQKIEYGVSC